MPELEISAALYERLLRRIASFDDTAEDVIRRMLDEVESAPQSVQGKHVAPGAGGSGSQPSREAPGPLLSLSNYWLPILQILDEAGGWASANEVITALPERIGNELTDADLESVRNGEIRWRNRARFARLRMKERGFLATGSPRGIWEITDPGRTYLRQRQGEKRKVRDQDS